MTRRKGITWDHPRGLAPLVALGPQSGPTNDVIIEWAARSLQAFADHPLEQLVKEYDVLVIDHPHIPLVSDQGLLVRLDKTGHDAELALLARQSVGRSHASYSHGGHQYALAIDAATQVSTHRPDLIMEPPRSWPAVLELAGEGRVLWPGKPVDAMSSFLTLAAQMGGPVCSDKTGFVGRDVGLAVLDLLHQLVDRIGPSCLAANPINVADRLSSTDECYYAPLVFGYVNYSRPGFRPHQLAYRDMPVGPRGVTGSCLGGAGIAVSARSAEKEAAVACAFWLASAKVQRDLYYWAGGQPANALAWEDQSVNKDCLDFFSATRATIEGASVRPRYPGWMVLQERAGELVHAALSGDIGEDACLDGLDAEREPLIGDGIGG